MSDIPDRSCARIQKSCDSHLDELSALMISRYLLEACTLNQFFRIYMRSSGMIKKIKIQK